MITLARPSYDCPILRYDNGPHEPWITNGERTLGRLLERRGYNYLYERVSFPFRYVHPDGRTIDGGFVPDFVLLPAESRPMISVELTFADHGLPVMPRAIRAANLERLELKRLKIAHTSKLYGVETVLVTYASLRDIMACPRRLDQKIAAAAARHRRHQRDLRDQFTTVWDLPIAA